MSDTKRSPRCACGKASVGETTKEPRSAQQVTPHARYTVHGADACANRAYLAGVPRVTPEASS